MQGVRCNIPTKSGEKKRTFRLVSTQFYPTKELEELTGRHEFRIKPESLESLCNMTKFTKKEIKLLYRGFKQDCPSGSVREETFKMLYAQFFPRSSDSSQYSHFIFNSFDKEKTGSITFTNFLVGLSALTRGTNQDKLKWVFNMYDINNDGVLTKDELFQIVSSITDLMGRPADAIFHDKENTDKIFQKLDVNRKGFVTFNQFLNLCLEDENIINSLDVFNTIF